MTVYLETRIHRYVGVASDTKPADESLPGSLFYETDTGNWFVWDGAAWTSYSYPYSLETARSQFLANLQQVIGPAAVTFMPEEADGTTSVDKSRNEATITHNATAQGRLVRRGLGWALVFDGVPTTGNFSYLADADRFSFGNGSLDSAYSVVVLLKATNTANNRTIFGKFTTNQREYRAYIATNDTLQWGLYDESSDGGENLSTDAAVPQDAYFLLVLTYDGSEDSDGQKAYVNGSLVAATKTSDVGAAYTAMENGTSVLGIGAGTNAASLPFEGEIAHLSIVPVELTADDVWVLRNLFDGFYDFLD